MFDKDTEYNLKNKSFAKTIYRIFDFFLTRNSIPFFGFFSKKIRLFLARRISKGIQKGATIEKGAVIVDGVYCSKHGCIGYKCITCWGLHIGSNTMMGHNCSFYSINHKRSFGGKKVFDGYTKPKPIYIGDNCWIGSNVIIVGGVHIGSGTTVAAGSVVSHDCPSFSLIAGNPAIVKKTYNKPVGYCDNL